MNSQRYSLDQAEALYDILNKKHFTEGAILNDTTFLLRSCEEVNFVFTNNDDGGTVPSVTPIDTQEVAEFFNSKLGEASVWRTINHLHEIGIDSIPTLIVNGGSSHVSGAARSEDIYSVLAGEVNKVKPGATPLFKIDLM
jgi:hypothetical protein